MDIGCNRLENGVKPQPCNHETDLNGRCNRLENAVKPQPNYQQGIQKQPL